jgi:hypothetical protein
MRSALLSGHAHCQFLPSLKRRLTYPSEGLSSAPLSTRICIQRLAAFQSPELMALHPTAHTSSIHPLILELATTDDNASSLASDPGQAIRDEALGLGSADGHLV